MLKPVMWLWMAIVLVSGSAGEKVAGAEEKVAGAEEEVGATGDTYEIRRQVNIVEILRRHLPRKGGKALDFPDTSDLIGKDGMLLNKDVLQMLPNDGHCQVSASTMSGKCCFNLTHAGAENFRVDGCVTFKYLAASKDLDVAININDFPIAHFKININLPTPACIDLTFGKVCADFHDISFEGGFHGCVDLIASVMKIPIKLASWCWGD